MNDDSGRGKLLHASGAYLGGPESEARWMGETCARFLATGRTTNNQFTLIDETAKRGEAIPLHRHFEDVESFYVLDGEMTFFIDNQPGISACEGYFLHVPAGTIHGFRVVSETARYLILTTPRHGEFYRAISVPAGADGLPASYDVDWETVMATAKEYGIELVGDLPES